MSSPEALAPMASAPAAAGSAVVSAVAGGGAAADGTEGDERFFAELPELTTFADVLDLDRHAALPLSSLLVWARVGDAARALEAGRYQDVNAVAAASIIAVCNALRGVEVPYQFGGDRAWLVVPGSRRAAVERSLRGARALAAEGFGLSLQAGVLPLAELCLDGRAARVARYRPGPRACLAMFSGDAFALGERWLSDDAGRRARELAAEGPSEADFSGLECRWLPVESARGHVVTLLVHALAPGEAERAQTYRDLLNAFERIVDAEACHPLKLSGLELAGWLGDHSVEARVRARSASGPEYAAVLRSVRKQALASKWLGTCGLSTGGFGGRRYRRELIQCCDYRRLDGSLRLVVDLNVAEIYRLESRLSAEQRAGRLAFALHRSAAALLTCVRRETGEHVCFVDGSEGGYALAARELEERLAEQARAGGKRPRPAAKG